MSLYFIFPPITLDELSGLLANACITLYTLQPTQACFLSDVFSLYHIINFFLHGVTDIGMQTWYYFSHLNLCLIYYLVTTNPFLYSINNNTILLFSLEHLPSDFCFHLHPGPSTLFLQKTPVSSVLLTLMIKS